MTGGGVKNAKFLRTSYKYRPYPDGEAYEDEHNVAHVEGGRLADAKLLVHVELDVICFVESPDV